MLQNKSIVPFAGELNYGQKIARATFLNLYSFSRRPISQPPVGLILCQAVSTIQMQKQQPV